MRFLQDTFNGGELGKDAYTNMVKGFDLFEGLDWDDFLYCLSGCGYTESDMKRDIANAARWLSEQSVKPYHGVLYRGLHIRPGADINLDWALASATNNPGIASHYAVEGASRNPGQEPVMLVIRGAHVIELPQIAGFHHEVLITGRMSIISDEYYQGIRRIEMRWKRRGNSPKNPSIT